MQGVKVWNEWRQENLAVRPDLQGLNIRGTVLGHADLSRADLRDAYMLEADLRGANLADANLESAMLLGADLGATIIARANLSKANLMMARFSPIGFYPNPAPDDPNRRAQASLANGLYGANFAHCMMGATTFVGIDLSNVKGLETVRHQGPSMISIDTITLSRGNIPEIFLRGAGVPDNFIQFMRSLMETRFECYSCFISYSSKDQEFAGRLHGDLQANGVRCWLATEDLRIGDRFRQQIDDAIRLYDKLLVVLSEDSVNSSWVEKEVETAFEKERTSGNKIMLFPIQLDDEIMQTGQAWAADIRRTRHIGDFRRWRDRDSYQKAFLRLLRDLRGDKEITA